MQGFEDVQVLTVETFSFPLEKCAVCKESKADQKSEKHEFEQDPALPKWRGWYSLRRGVATTLAGLTRDGMASKGLLRHANLANHNSALCKRCAGKHAFSDGTA